MLMVSKEEVLPILPDCGPLLRKKGSQLHREGMRPRSQSLTTSLEETMMFDPEL